MRNGIIAILATMVAAPGVLAQPAPPRIPVVKTWEDLQTAPAIDLAGGVKVRLGLEADKLPRWSGGLLYCLAEDYTPPASGAGKPPFGPVYAQVAFEKEKEPADSMRWARAHSKAKGTYLYVRAIPVARVGTYHVTVTDGKGSVLAQASITGTKDFFHPWMPWLEGFDDPQAPWEGIALPSVDSLGPAVFIEPDEGRKGRLPTLLPPGDKPRLTIKLEGNELVIRSATKFTASRPDYHFLARWWVNGRPFVPKQIDKLGLFAGYGRVSAGKEMRVAFTFRPERLGAKPGDKIGLQLVHCESEWAWCTDPAHGIHKGASSAHGENVRLSNRIEFDLPKK